MTKTPDPADVLAPGAHLHDRMEIAITEVSIERVVGTMPVKGNTQPFGVLHGGASAVLAEQLGSTGSNAHARTLGKIALGTELNATHHRSATAGVVTGVATPIHLGRSSACYEIVITDEAGKRLCTARLTCALVDPARFA